MLNLMHADKLVHDVYLLPLFRNLDHQLQVWPVLLQNALLSLLPKMMVCMIEHLYNLTKITSAVVLTEYFACSSFYYTSEDWRTSVWTRQEHF